MEYRKLPDVKEAFGVSEVVNIYSIDALISKIPVIVGTNETNATT
jgi:hypothetical protein